MVLPSKSVFILGHRHTPTLCSSLRSRRSHCLHESPDRWKTTLLNLFWHIFQFILYTRQSTFTIRFLSSGSPSADLSSPSQGSAGICTIPSRYFCFFFCLKSGLPDLKPNQRQSKFQSDCIKVIFHNWVFGLTASLVNINSISISRIGRRCTGCSVWPPLSSGWSAESSSPPPSPTSLQLRSSPQICSCSGLERQACEMKDVWHFFW